MKGNIKILAISSIVILTYKILNYKDNFTKGIEFLNKNKYDSSIYYFNESYKEKIHSKTAYYISLCYFYLNNDSLSIQFAKKALLISPRIDTIKYYADRIKVIILKSELRTRFKDVHLSIEMSSKVNFEKFYYSNKSSQLQNYYNLKSDGFKQMEKDYYYSSLNDLPYMNQQVIDSCNSENYFKSLKETNLNSKFQFENGLKWQP